MFTLCKQQWGLDMAIELLGIVQEGFRALITKLIVRAGEAGFDALVGRGSTAGVLDFGSHLERTFARCTEVRTLLNRDVSVKLLEKYVHLKFSSNRKVLDDYQLIDLPLEFHPVAFRVSGSCMPDWVG
jgi:hypothetical protein